MPSTGPTRIRQINKRAVLSCIRNEGDQSRSALGPALSLSPAAVSSVVNELLNRELLLEAESTKNGRKGRPKSLLSLNANAAYALGIVLKPTKTNTMLGLAWVDYTGHTTPLTDINVGTRQDLDLLISTIHDAINTLENEVPDASRIFGVTIAIPGVVDNETIPMAPKLPCIEGTTFIEKLKQDIKYPVSFQNDVNLAAMSELYQQPRLRELSFAYLYLYSGVGSGFAIEGNILNGSGGWAGEIGQLHVNRRDSNSTSFEHLLTTDGSLADLLERLGHPRNDLKKLAEYIDESHPETLAMVDLYCEHICDAINVLNSVLDLDEILIDFRSDELFKRLRPRLEVLLQTSRRQPVISTPVMGHEATLNGAALSALTLALPTIEK